VESFNALVVCMSFGGRIYFSELAN
jgi:hypothetical protein